ncbi:proteasome ATPase [Corynebacterium sp. MC-04]|uniref:AAA ATPase forming ring-shaped complexes n=1 Tax=Corynebacterium parakroppenstedtii TaxID=2828363 RepID=A0ABS9HI73_9CORY|nr:MULTISPECIES: proteasome ATPase [Corynebacterium]MDU3197788.1 proteasome ATPase [Corynebacterium kroppenstedtii]MBY0787654.1 proteasome ATPase [Corynebacterium parakroppenstedtii]MBY0791727.1 proteasome ATPase [Corynebacterium parakroppenstedtii]MBY0796515.1 proteasome ATPase [Corynebacterium parakroppenstedtii]MCF6768680.1 proteasome ATPase [Corynebacterium parakroppenstedtii]
MTTASQQTSSHSTASSTSRKGNNNDATPSLKELQLANRTLGTRNAKLVEMLKASRDKLDALNEQIRALSDPPSTYGTLLELNPGGHSAEVFTSNRRMRLVVAPGVDTSQLTPGALVRLGEGQEVVEHCGFSDFGDIAVVKEFLPGGSRVVVADTMGDLRVLKIAAPLYELWSQKNVGAGDQVLVDYRAGYAFESIPKADVENLILEEIPEVSYEDIGGLHNQIEMIHDAVELPFTHPDLYRKFDLQPPKGVLLYGPPGCGKTLIAKAVAHSLAEKMGSGGESYFLNIKGPELLNKFVGETERQIRQIFDRARSIAEDGRPVIVFFDEMDAIFRTRGSGISSDLENTVVPQLLSEIDGVEDLRNVIVIGASNREEMIDPAILRPGRLDVKIRVERPDEKSAREIAELYLVDTLPLDPALVEETGDRHAAVAALIDELSSRMYAQHSDNEFVELTFVDGSREVLYYRDFASGAMIANIVDRAKKNALKRALASGQPDDHGVSLEDVRTAVDQEFAENDDLPNTANPDEWARISGRTGQRVTEVTVARHNRKTTTETEATEPADTDSGKGHTDAS